MGKVWSKETDARLQALLGTDKSISTIAKSGLASEVTEDKVGFVPPFLQYFKTSDEHLNKLVSKMVKEIREEGGASLETVNQVYGYINKTPGLLTNVFADSNCKKLMEGLIKLRVACEGNKLARLQYIPAGGTSPYIPPEEGRTYLAAVRSTKEQLQPIKLAMAQVITPLIEKPKVDLQAAKQVDTNPQTTTMKKSAKTYKRASTGVAYNLLSNTNGKVYIAGYLSGIVKNVTLEKVGSQLILKYTIKGKDYSVTIKDPKATISIYKETGGGPIKVGETKYDPFK